MKKFLLLFTFTLIVPALSFGVTLEGRGNITIALFDGRSIDLKKDVETVYLYNKKLDYLELKSGEIVDRTDITKLIAKGLRNPISTIQMIGVDGGG